MSLDANRGARLFTLRNGRGLVVAITNYGGSVVALQVPDRHGHLADVVLGFGTLERYQGPHPYFGALIGRFGNRIAGGRFRLDQHDYVLSTNDGANHLHGGLRGFDRAFWAGELINSKDGPALSLKHTSVDGDEGYPGTLATTVIYTLTERNELRIDYSATTDAPTIVNLTHHSYFNLAGHDQGDVLGHELFIDAAHFTPTDAGLIPTGERRPVLGTPFDFTKPTLIGARLLHDDAQLAAGRGYDHNFVLNRSGQGLVLVARAFEPGSGRVMEVLTTEPGLHLYTGNALDESMIGKNNAVYRRHSGFCLETQHFPDSPNQEAFPSTRLEPGQRYESSTIYRFGVAAWPRDRMDQPESKRESPCP